MRAKDLPKLIPSSIRITKDVSYEIVYVEEFPAPYYQYGECRFDSKQIVLNKNQAPSELYKTYLHELIHAVDMENESGLTEKQVRKLEEGIYKVLKLNGVLK